MTFTCQSGDVLRHKLAGTYLRVGGPHPTEPRIWCQDCDADGHITALHGRYLLATTLASHYEHAPTPTERYDR